MSQNKLDDSILEKYEKILAEERDITIKLIQEIESEQRNGSKNSSGDLSSYSIHQADQGSDTNSMERRVYLLGEQQKKLKKIHYSLRKIYNKTYGICEICGEYIPEPRLEIIPFAKYCVECESEEEKKKKYAY